MAKRAGYTAVSETEDTTIADLVVATRLARSRLVLVPVTGSTSRDDLAEVLIPA